MGHSKTVIQRVCLSVAPFAAIGIAWFLVTQSRLVRPVILPSPQMVWQSFVSTRPLLLSASIASLKRILTGFVIGSGVGVLYALLMAYSPIVFDVSNTVINLVRPVPIYSLIPLFILWFGIGMAQQIALISFGTFVILVISTLEALRNVRSIYIRAARTLGASRLQVFGTVVVPAIVPELVGAIRVASGASFGLNVAAEFMGAQSGLGYIMIVHSQYLRTEGVIVTIILIGLLCFCLDRVLSLVESRITRWSGRRSKSGGFSWQ